MNEIAQTELAPKFSLTNLLRKPHKSVHWDKTRLAISNIKLEGFYEESDKDSKYGYFQERPIIARDTPIQGGVYVGGGDREAIVVDDTKKNSELERIYQNFLAGRKKIVEEGGHFKQRILGDVLDTVQKELPFDKQKVEDIVRKHDAGDNQKILLDVFIREKAGVCRHEALLGAYMLERLAKEGYIRGKVSIDRNFVPGRGGHAWIRYRSEDGIVVIIDPAQDYIGKLDDVDTDNQWFYERPSDRGLRALLQRIINRT